MLFFLIRQAADVFFFFLVEKALFSSWEKAVLSKAAEQCRVSLEAVEDIYPCTPFQEGLVASQARSGISYTGRSILTIHRGIDIPRLEHAIERTVRRHPALRTRIVDLDSHGLTQVVLKSGDKPSLPSPSSHLQSLTTLGISDDGPGARQAGLAVSGLHNAGFLRQNCCMACPEMRW